MHIEQVEANSRVRCWHWAGDGSGERVTHTFAAEEIETTEERNARGAEEDHVRKPKKSPRLHDV